MKSLARFMEWITSFKGFFISLFIYGMIEIALYLISDNTLNFIDPFDRSEGWFDRREYPAGSFRGTYLPLMQVFVAAVYAFSFTRKFYFFVKAIARREFGFANVKLILQESCGFIRSILIFPFGTTPSVLSVLMRTAFIYGVMLLMYGSTKGQFDFLILNYVGVGLVEGAETIFNGIFVREGERFQKDVYGMFVILFPFLVSCAFLIIESFVIRTLAKFGVITNEGWE